MQIQPNSSTGIISTQDSVVNTQQADPRVQTLRVKHFCQQCTQPASKICGRCQLVYYCSDNCQKTAWNTHHKCICAPKSQPEKYTQRDPLGFTLLHYAVLNGLEKTLPPEQKAQLMSVKDSYNGTPNDLKSHMAPPSDGEISLQMIHAEGEVRSLTQDEFLKRTTVRFKDGYMTTPEVLLKLHSSPPEPDPYTALISDSKVKNFEKAPPVVYLAKEPGMDLGLKAGQDIGKGEIICRCAGELTLTERTNYRTASYRMQRGTDQDRISGPGAFVNDGPPNCGFAYIKNYKGIPQYYMVVALRPIKKGEFLHACYGTRHIPRGGKYVISAQSYQEVVEFCQAGQFYREQNSLFAGLFDYIWGVSNVFFKLHLEEVLNVNKTKQLMQNKKNDLMLETPLYYKFYPQGLKVIESILKLKEKDKKIVSSVVGLTETLTEPTFLQILLLMNKYSKLQSTSIPAYQALGTLFDHLYQVLYGTLNGSYPKESSGEKTPNFPLDLRLIAENFNLLSYELKVEFLQKVNIYIDLAEKEGALGKKQDFEQLLVLYMRYFQS